MALFSSTIFNSSVFNTGAATPVVPVFQEAKISGGGGAGLNPYMSTLRKTSLMPGMRTIIEAEDEAILKVIVEAVTKDRLH